MGTPASRHWSDRARACCIPPSLPPQGIQTEAQTIDALQQAILATIHNGAGNNLNLFAALHTLGAEQMPGMGAMAAAAAAAGTGAGAGPSGTEEEEQEAAPSTGWVWSVAKGSFVCSLHVHVEGKLLPSPPCSVLQAAMQWHATACRLILLIFMSPHGAHCTIRTAPAGARRGGGPLTWRRRRMAPARCKTRGRRTGWLSGASGRSRRPPSTIRGRSWTKWGGRWAGWEAAGAV